MSQYQLDVQKRETLHESYYVEHQKSTVRFQIPHPEDEKILAQYFKDNSEAKLDYSKIIQKSIDDKLAIIASDCFDVCALILARVVERNGDSTEDQLNLENFLPKENKYVCVEWLNVRKDYQNAGIGTKLLKELLRLVQKYSINHVCLVSDDELVIKIAKKFKMKTKHSVKNRKPAAKEVMVVNVREIGNFLQDDPPTLPKAYQLLDLERPQLGEHYAKALGRPLQYVIGVPEDEEIVKNFLLNEYFRQTTIPRSLQCTRSDGAELITRFDPIVLKQGLVFMAHDNGRLCGLAVNKFIKVQRPDPKLNEEIPENFSDEIDKQTLSHLGGRTIRAVCRWMDSLTPQMMNDNYDSYYLLDMLTVQPSYRGCKIGWKLWYESLKHSKQLGYHYTQTICTAVASNRLATQFGMKCKIEFPYEMLKYRGKKFFEDGKAYDGGKVICMYLGEADKLTLGD